MLFELHTRAREVEIYKIRAKRFQLRYWTGARGNLRKLDWKSLTFLFLGVVDAKELADWTLRRSATAEVN